MNILPFDSTLVLALLLVAGVLTSHAQETTIPEPGKQIPRESTLDITEGKATVRYWLYFPDESVGKPPLPLVLFLHGAGERGSDLELVKKWGPPQQVDGGQALPFLLVSPQCPAGESWNLETLEKLVESAVAEFPVDPHRVYVTGLSMGGYGTWNLLARRPDLFAAGIPICGGGNIDDAESLKDIPIWAFHGDQDTAVPLGKSQEMVAAIEKANGQMVKLTVYPGVGHNSWSATYDNPEVYRWLLRQKRSGQ